MTSGVPRGSVLGPQLFTIYIDDLELGIKCNVSKFADDTKMSGRAKCTEDAASLQRDIDSLSEWARVWQMEYNVGKCEVIHFGRNNSKMDDYLNGKKLQYAAVQRDLGVLVQESQGVGLQVQQVIKKANGILSFIARGMEFETARLCCSCIRCW